MQNTLSALLIHIEFSLLTVLGGQGWHITSIFLDYDTNKIRKAVWPTQGLTQLRQRWGETQGFLTPKLMLARNTFCTAHLTFAGWARSLLDFTLILWFFFQYKSNTCLLKKMWKTQKCSKESQKPLMDPPLKYHHCNIFNWIISSRILVLALVFFLPEIPILMGYLIWSLKWCP